MLKNNYLTLLKIQLLFFLCLVSIDNNIFAQIKSEIVVVPGNYNPTLSDAYKITFNPTMKDTVFEAPKLNYSIQSKNINTTITLDPIKPAKIAGDPVVKLYKNLIKAGFGNYTTPYFELFSNNTRSKTDAFGAHVKYLASFGSITDYDKSDYSNLNMELYGKKYLTKSTLDGEVFFSRNALNYYGYDHSITYSPELTTKQRYATIGFNSSYYSNYVDSASLNHKLTLGVSNISDLYKSGETNVKVGVDVSQNLKLFKLTDKQTVGVKADLDFYANSGDTIAKSSSSLVKVFPYISTHFNEYMLLVGINVNVLSGGQSKLHLYPVIEGSLAVIPKVLKVFAGIKGETTRSSFKYLSDVNPFIASTVPLGFSNNKFEFYGGINTSLTKTIDFTARLSNKSIDGMPLFVNDIYTVTGFVNNFVNGNKFTVVYDNVNVFNINSELSWKYSDKISMLIKANWNQYSTSTEEKAWHKPALDASFSINYNINNKIITHAELFAYSKMYSRSVINNKIETVEVSGMFDFNLGIDYRITKIFSAFININNLTASQYSNWYNYPNQRFNLMAGLTYAF